MGILSLSLPDWSSGGSGIRLWVGVGVGDVVVDHASEKGSWKRRVVPESQMNSTALRTVALGGGVWARAEVVALSGHFHDFEVHFSNPEITGGSLIFLRRYTEDI